MENNRKLLITDLSGRLPYKVKMHVEWMDNGVKKENIVTLCPGNLTYIMEERWWTSYKPYLRPMSSMTEEERKEYINLTHAQNWLIIGEADKYIDWLNAHHFDYRGLIPMGLALEAPEGMYEFK